jgi:hypothetical protein
MSERRIKPISVDLYRDDENVHRWYRPPRGGRTDRCVSVQVASIYIVISITFLFFKVSSTTNDSDVR